MRRRPSRASRFRNARPDDWATLADVVNRARRADGMDEVFIAEALRAEYEPMDWFRDRPRRPGRRDRRRAGRDGVRVARPARDARSSLETWGVVLAEHRRRGHRHGPPSRAPAPGWPPRRPRIRVPGERSFRTWALDIERSDIGAAPRRGLRPHPVRVRDAPVPHRRPARARRCPTASSSGRSPASSIGPSWMPTTRPSATTGAIASRTRATSTRRYEHPETDTSLWCVAWDGDQVAGSVMNAIFLDENRQLGPQARLARARLGAAPVARPRRCQGVVRGLVPGAEGARDRRRRGSAWTRPTRRARSSCTRASGSTSRAAGRRSGGRWTARRRRGLAGRRSDEPRPCVAPARLPARGRSGTRARPRSGGTMRACPPTGPRRPSPSS